MIVDVDEGNAVEMLQTKPNGQRRIGRRDVNQPISAISEHTHLVDRKFN